MKKNVNLLLWAVVYVVVWASCLFVTLTSVGASEVTSDCLSPPETVSYGMPALYPANVKTMTDAEFFRWAVKRNTREESNWFTKANSLPSRYYTSKGVVHKTSFSVSASDKTRTNAVGISMMPRQSYGSTTQESYEVQRRYTNPNYTWPGPLTIINPYVRPK